MKSAEWLRQAMSEFSAHKTVYSIRDGDSRLLVKRLRKAAKLRGLEWTFSKKGRRVEIKPPCFL